MYLHFILLVEYKFRFSPDLSGFSGYFALNQTKRRFWNSQNAKFSHFVMAISDQYHANVSKQTTLLDGIDVGPPKWCVCGRGLNQFVHDDMNTNSMVKVHLKTCSGNVNIFL